MLHCCFETFDGPPPICICCSFAKQFVSMVPSSIQVAKDDPGRSTLGAWGLAFTLFGGIGWAVATTLWKLSS